MHTWRRAAAALLLILLGASCAAAQETDAEQEARWIYGGSGEDRLLELTEAGGGFFAAGTTASSDGDLSVRTRTGSAGWALLVGEDGERIWSYASAHAGLARMICPTVLGGGRYAVVLTDEQAQRGEWLILDERGRLLSRTAVSPQALGMEGGHEVLAYLFSQNAPAELTLLLADPGKGTLCAAAIDETGRVSVGSPFYSGLNGVAASDSCGNLAWVGTGEGEGLSVTWLEGGETAQASGLSFADFAVEEVLDALMQDDGSVVCCGRTKAGGFAVRVSREGETLFCRVLDHAQRRLCHTESGYALYGDEDDEGKAAITFLDEDGAVLDTAIGLPADALDLCGAPGGAALLTHLEGYRQKQAVITRAAQRETAPQEEQQEPEAHGVQGDALEAAGGLIGMDEGYLLCESEGFGVQVRYIDAHGQEVFCTRTPIHTAADELQWCCAARLADGSILLGGRYLIGMDGQQRQQGVAALLDGQGVLRSMETIEQAGAVCGISLDASGGVALLVSSSDLPALQADAALAYLPAGN